MLAQIAEISKNARTTWFGLIFLLLYCSVTLLDIRDRDFLEFAAETQLPLLGIEVPVVGFFLSAPMLVLGIFAYFHVYLSKLWLELGSAPAKPNGVDLDRAIFPWLLSDAALRLRDDVPRRHFGATGWLSAILIGWVFGPIVMGAFWIRSWPYHHEGLTLLLGAMLWIAVWISADSWKVLRSLIRHPTAPSTTNQPGRNWRRISAGISFAVLIGLVSWEKTEGGIAKRLGIVDDETAFLWRANLAGAELVRIPRDWKGRDIALREDRRSSSEAHGAEVPEGAKHPTLESEFNAVRSEAFEPLSYLNQLKGIDLRRADLTRAILVGADLTKAKLDYADFGIARAEGAIMTAASARSARLYGARLEQSDLALTDFTAANLMGARLDNAILGNTNLEFANLIHASFSGTWMYRAKTRFSNAVAADFTGAQALTQEMVAGMFGDGATKLPADLLRPAHWAIDELDYTQSEEQYCAWLEEQNQVSRFCK